ncbi:LIM domain-containing protein jub isoform X2 [Cololabis saira]|uniref:LIM domain-containing protein jub isoform X2 n=1 Tax=Cololabis saira TaxID=129043 RepID=UPI002AD46C35|nr:LIM domain-containing protein jub isoform X2 [Cololabis saira]
MDRSYSPNLYFGSCTRCREGVYGTGAACQAMGHLFHNTCFTCSVCNKQLNGKPFFTVSGLIYCEDDYLFSGVHPPQEVCNVCGCSITDLSSSGPAGSREVVPPVLLSLRHLQTGAGGSGIRSRLRVQGLLCQRLLQGPSTALCCLQGVNTSNRGFYRVYSSRII